MDTVAQVSNADRLNANSTQTSIYKKATYYVIHKTTRNKQQTVTSPKNTA